MIEPLGLLWYVVILCCVAPALLIGGVLGVLILTQQVLERINKGE